MTIERAFFVRLSSVRRSTVVARSGLATQKNRTQRREIETSDFLNIKHLSSKVEQVIRSRAAELSVSARESGRVRPDQCAETSICRRVGPYFAQRRQSSTLTKSSGAWIS